MKKSLRSSLEPSLPRSSFNCFFFFSSSFFFAGKSVLGMDGLYKFLFYYVFPLFFCFFRDRFVLPSLNSLRDTERQCFWGEKEKVPSALCRALLRSLVVGNHTLCVFIYSRGSRSLQLYTSRLQHSCFAI